MVATVSGHATNIFQRGHNTRTVDLDGQPEADMSSLARIVGGSTADPTLYPFFAYFEILKTEFGEQGNFICGGSLIAPDIVLSAAHCFHGDVQNVAVIVNNTNFKEFTGYEYDRQVVSFKAHPDYIHETYTNDICIVVLSSPVTEVTPVTLNTERSTPQEGANVQVIGMGFTKEVGPDDDSKPFPDLLLMTELQIVPTDTCSNQYTNAGEQAINDELAMCAYATGKDSCQGDSGGPLLQTVGDSFLQVGLVSYGKGCAKEVSYRYRVQKIVIIDWSNTLIYFVVGRGFLEFTLASVHTLISFNQRFVGQAKVHQHSATLMLHPLRHHNKMRRRLQLWNRQRQQRQHLWKCQRVFLLIQLKGQLLHRW